MAYVELGETLLDANSGFIESTSLGITRNLVSHESRLTALESFMGAEIWTSKSSNYSLSVNDVNGNYGFYATANLTFTLPSAVSGYKVVIANFGASLLTVAATTGDVIYTASATGETSISVTNTGAAVILWCIDSATWVAVSDYNWTGAGIGLIGGGNTGATTDTIDSITIASTGNATDYANLSTARERLGACSSSSRAIFGGGESGGSSNVIDYIAYTGGGTATDFGDLLAANTEICADSNSTYGIFSAGYDGSFTSNTQIITIASAGNASDWGDISTAIRSAQALSNGTRHFTTGGENGASVNINVIEFNLYASNGAATDLGDLTQGIWGHGRATSSTLGYTYGGTTNGTTVFDDVEKFTMASTPTHNSTEISGLLTDERRSTSGTSSLTRGVCAGGHDGVAVTNIIDYHNFSAENTWADFGDLSVARRHCAATSNGHGGLVV